MSTPKVSKINRSMQEWHKGSIMLSSFLQRKGYQKDLLKRYVTSRWLDSLGYGAYKIANDEVNLYSAISALQTQKQSKVHPGGKTALELKGYAHYIKQGNTKTELFYGKDEVIPRWFLTQSWKETIDAYATKIFGYDEPKIFVQLDIKNVSVKISSPELAILEMLYLVPKVHSFEEADLIMESLTTLRGDLLQQLLEKCNSVKVKRAFLYLSEKHNHSWFKDIDQTKIYLGSGKREIVKNGRLDKKYNITVPRENEG